MNNTKKTKIFTFNSTKGGTGKTTLSVLCANILKVLNKKVLVIDCDRENNSLSAYYENFLPDRLEELKQIVFEKNIKNFFSQATQVEKETKTKIEKLEQQTSASKKEKITEIAETKKNAQKQYQTILKENIIQINDNIDLLHGISDLKPNALNSSNTLKLSLEANKNYDYIIIDTTPTYDQISENAIIASNYIIIPTLLSTFNLQANVSLLENITTNPATQYNKQVKIVINQYSKPPKNQSKNSNYNQQIQAIFDDSPQNNKYLLDEKIPLTISLRKYIDITDFKLRDNKKNQHFFPSVKECIKKILDESEINNQIKSF